MATRTLAELATELGGEVIGDGRTEIRGVAGIREAQAGDITFLANSRYEAYLDQTNASAVICARDARSASVPQIRVDNPYLAFQTVVRIFRPELYQAMPGVHPTAVVHAAAFVGEGASVGPHCVVEAGARIGVRSVLMPGCYVGVQASIGEDCLLYPRVTVREECVIGDRCILHPGVVIGADGFGFAFDAGRYHKVPQVGNVIDRSTTSRLGRTRRSTAPRRTPRGSVTGRRSTTSCRSGTTSWSARHCIIVAQVGISGSTRARGLRRDRRAVGPRRTHPGRQGCAGRRPGGCVEVGRARARRSGVRRPSRSRS